MKFGRGGGGTKGGKEEQWEEEKKLQEDDMVAGHRSLLAKRPIAFGRELGMIFCSKATDRHLIRVGRCFGGLA